MIILEDIEALQQGKIDKTQIKNSLTETQVGNTLDATQGKVLNDKIDILSNDRGYLNTIRLADNTDFNTITKNGKYKVVYGSGGAINSPNDSYYGSYSIDVTENGESGYVYQKATCFWSTGDLLGKTFERYQAVGVWTEWQQIATTDNISNPNLLINGDFQVWQRGESFTDGYTADRWKVGSDAGVRVSKQPFGLRFEALSVGSWHNFEQLIEVQPCLIGKTLTLSLKLNSASTVKQMYYGYRDSSGGLHGIGGVFSGEVKDFWTWTFSIPKEDVKILWVGFQLLEEVGAKLDIEWVKLEIGDKATPFSPRQYAEELAMCQRYYVGQSGVISSNKISNPTTGVLVNSTSFPCIMRVAPTITIYDINGTPNVCSRGFAGISYGTGNQPVSPADIWNGAFTSYSRGGESADTIFYKYSADAEIY